MVKAGFELFYAARIRNILHYLGQFFLIIGCLNIVNVFVAFLYKENSIGISYIMIVTLLLGAGLAFTRINLIGQLQLNEAMVVATMVFVLIPLLTALPLYATGLAYVDTFFETVSAVTTTGLSTLGPVDSRPQTFIFARAWMQWYGGLGIVVLSLALVVRPGLSAMRLAMIESGDDDLAGGTRAFAKKTLVVYLAITGAGFLIWLVLGGQPLEGLLYSLAAVSTGGFSPTNNSFADLSGIRLAWVVSLTCLAGAVPLALYQSCWRKGWRHFCKNHELQALILAALLTTVALGICLRAEGMQPGEILTHAPVMALSAQTTSGFSSLDTASLGFTSKAVMILAMSTGGGVGSTAGGFKLLRILILFVVLSRLIIRMGMPARAVMSQKMNGKVVTDDETQDALLIILAFIGVVFLSWLPFLYYGYNPLDAMFEVVSATATVGLSSGITDASLPTVLKYILCADMLFGRLEFIAWMVLLYPRTWFGRKREA